MPRCCSTFLTWFVQAAAQLQADFPWGCFLGKKGWTGSKSGPGAVPRLHTCPCIHVSCDAAAPEALGTRTWSRSGIAAVCQGNTHGWTLPKTPHQHSWTPTGKHLQVSSGLSSIFNVPILTQPQIPISLLTFSRLQTQGVTLSLVYQRDQFQFYSPLVFYLSPFPRIHIYPLLWHHSSVVMYN